MSGRPLGLVLVTRTPGAAQQLTVSGDLVDWTTTPLSEVTGIDDDVNPSVFVGADRIVVRATPYGGGDDGMRGERGLAKGWVASSAPWASTISAVVSHGAAMACSTTNSTRPCWMSSSTV